ncbi:MAG: hypothetical protein EXR27_22565 [Betaproteobacteria bacterium]|nr:hypothetical protein [Betaproteobacteria bacterium]
MALLVLLTFMSVWVEEGNMLSAFIRTLGLTLCTLLAGAAMAQPVAAGAPAAALKPYTEVTPSAPSVMRKFNLPAVDRSSRLDVIYLGSKDCRFCQQWEFDSRAKLLESREARAFSFHEIKNDTLAKPITAADYPADLQWVYKKVGAMSGVPRFLLAIDGRVVMNSLGTGGYKRNFLPTLNEVVRVSGKNDTLRRF